MASEEVTLTADCTRGPLTTQPSLERTGGAQEAEPAPD